MNKIFIVIVLFCPLLLRPQVSVEFIQLNTGCSSSCSGIIQANPVGGIPPYIFDWKGVSVDPNDETIAINLCGGIHAFTITDSHGNFKDTAYFVETMNAPPINIRVTPSDTIYIQNPTVQFFFENPETETNPIDDWLWNFGDGNTTNIESPTHTFTNIQEYFVSLQIYYGIDCDTTFVYPIRVRTVELIIPNIITPNGDGLNDVFIVTHDKSSPHSIINDFYISNELVILNRWGQKVFETKNYQNNWDGRNLADGVYFYILKCHGEFQDDYFRGSLTILRNNN